MPTVLISTLAEDGSTSLGPYSLVQPYYVAGKEYYAMLLNCRNSSNTAQHLLRTGKCAINFIPDDRKYFKWAVKLGWPGDTPAEKMKDCRFTLEKGIADEKEGPRPMVVKESFQVIECTWMRHLDGADRDEPGQMDGYEPPYHDFNGITSKFGATFILRVDKILMKPKYYNAIINGVKSRDFPRVPVDYGYRDSKSRPHRSGHQIHRRCMCKACQRTACFPADRLKGMCSLGKRERGHADHRRTHEYY